MKAKSMIVFCLQVLAATVGFLLSLLIGNLILPMPDAILGCCATQRISSCAGSVRTQRSRERDHPGMGGASL